MSFDRPLALLSLAVLAVLAAGFVTLARRRPRYVVRYPNVDVLRSVSSRASGVRRYAPLALVTAALALLGVAMAGPHVTRSAPVENATVVLVVDTSRSMLSTDVPADAAGCGQDGGTKVSRACARQAPCRPRDLLR